MGEHPYSTSGNGNMMASVLEQLDAEKYEAAAFVVNSPEFSIFDIFNQKYNLMDAAEGNQQWGEQKLIKLLNQIEVDFVIFIGIDIWRYAGIFPQIKQAKEARRFIWSAIFPWDLPFLRRDYIQWINDLDVPCVYSQFGFHALENHVPNLRYFRPQLRNFEAFHPFKEKDKEFARKVTFPAVPNDHLVMGFIGRNQVRKDPQRQIKAFMMAKEEYPNLHLYLHSELQGVYNLFQLFLDYGAKTGDVIMPTNKVPNFKKMARVYNALDWTINCSMHEGLSWTVLEAMACGTPVIASHSTAHVELLQKGGGILVPCEELAYFPSVTEKGQSWIETNTCRVDHIRDAILAMCKMPAEKRSMIGQSGRQAAENWLSGASNINDLLDDIEIKRPTIIHSKALTDAVLFAQHSAAGDVFMTTKALAGLKKRHNGLPLVYMTQQIYWDLLEGNPNIDDVIDWDEEKAIKYKFYYNPHKSRILPGHWGRNSNSLLSDFYWKILEVENGGFFIAQNRPEKEIAKTIAQRKKPILVVHTTGGDSQYRIYKYMADVVKELRDRYFIIQLGGANDYPAGKTFDLRGKLSFREAAWVMSKAHLAVTVDSFVSHLAGALGVSQVCLFGSGNHFVVKPDQVKGKLICMVPDYIRNCPGLGPCSASVRDCPATCTGIHDPKDIVKNIELLERSAKSKGFADVQKDG